jgi:hypothetical protein
VDLGGLRAMMVLLLKQMHLQKDVAEAVWIGDLAEVWLGWGAGNGLGWISCRKRGYVSDREKNTGRSGQGRRIARWTYKLRGSWSGGKK